ncbi:MAG TPA: hypothetical protein PLU22_11815, partial [Polyangiaceae bacterium]|nr:hypothetical protein [Polyangiaceae bacterium]
MSSHRTPSRWIVVGALLALFAACSTSSVSDEPGSASNGSTSAVDDLTQSGGTILLGQAGTDSGSTGAVDGSGSSGTVDGSGSSGTVDGSGSSGTVDGSGSSGTVDASGGLGNGGAGTVDASGGSDGNEGGRTYDVGSGGTLDLASGGTLD